jgi:hypothetical protein
LYKKAQKKLTHGIMLVNVATKTIYEQLTDVTYEYLGPASKRFIARMARAHLGKKPEELTREDVAKLHDWSKLGFAMLTEDEQTVNEYMRSLQAIAKPRKPCL